MTNGISGRRRRASVSLSMSEASSDPIDQLDWVVETFQQVNRALSRTALGRAEMIALGRQLTEISGALLALTDQLSRATQPGDRAQLPRRARPGVPLPLPLPLPLAAGSSLQHCREGIRATHLAARAFHADLR